MNADQALSLLGKYSKWQIRSYCLIAFGFGVPFAWMVMCIVFIGDTPNYRCALPPNATINETIPWKLTEDGTVEYERCSMYVNRSADNRTGPCQYGYWYDPESGYESTLTSEWDLVCGQEWLVELSMTISAIGAMIGAVIFNDLADRFGRKKVFLACLWSNVITGMARALSPNIIVFTLLAGVDGMQQQGILCSSFVLTIELFATEERTFAGNAIEFFWVFGYMSLVGIAYYLRNWRHLLISLTAPLLLTASFYWLISESIPWLISNGRKQEAEEILRKAAKTNNITLPDSIFDDEDTESSEIQMLYGKNSDGIGRSVAGISKLRVNSLENNIALEGTKIIQSSESPVVMEALCRDNVSKKEQLVVDQSIPKYRLSDLMRSKTTRRYYLALFPIWFVDCLAYAAINNTVTYLPGDRYLNTFMYAVLEIPAYTLTWILSHKIGRRKPLIWFHIVGGLALMGTVIQTFEFAHHINWLIVLLSMIGKLAVTSSFAMLYVITPEIFPTNSRNFGLGISEMFARSAQVLSPLARILYRYIPWLSPLVLGVLSTIMSFLAAMLPETRHTKLPDTIEEIQGWQ